MISLDSKVDSYRSVKHSLLSAGKKIRGGVGSRAEWQTRKRQAGEAKSPRLRLAMSRASLVDGSFKGSCDPKNRRTRVSQKLSQ